MDENQYEWHVCVIAQCTKYLLEFEYPELICRIKEQAPKSKLKFTVLQYFDPEGKKPLGDVSVFQYAKGMPTTDGHIRNIKNFNLYDPMVLKRFFKRCGLSSETKKIMFILWGHGAGLGYFPASGFDTLEKKTTAKLFEDILEPVASTGMPDKKIVEHTPENYTRIINFFQANFSKEPNFSQDSDAFIEADTIVSPLHLVNFKNALHRVKSKNDFNQKFKVLTAENFAKAIGDFERKIDILICANCYCQLFETGYALKNNVEIMVAAQTDYPSTSFDYKKLFMAMQDCSNSSIDLAKNICANFKAKYDKKYVNDAKARHNGRYTDISSFTSISANYLHVYESLLCIINKISTWLLTRFDVNIFESGSMFSKISGARDLCRCLDNEDDTWIIDFTHFLRQLKTKLQGTDAELETLLAKFEKLRKQCNKAILKPSDDRGIDTPPKFKNPLFLSAFFPVPGESKEVGDLIYELFYKPTISTEGTVAAASLWDDFVRGFHDIKFG